MKKTIKLDRNMLRGLIKEAIQGRQPGSPLWEMPGPRRMPFEPQGVDLHAWRDQWADAMKASYSTDDPVMAEYGEAAWEQQCEDAASDLYDGLESAVAEAEARLTGGSYWRDAPGPGHRHK